jgi:F-type H+-transporting ATPase subunit delta
MTLLAKRYARALFAAAEEAGATETVAADLGALREALAGEAGEIVLSPATSGTVRRQALDGLTGSAHELTRNLVGVALERRREAMLPELAGVFEQLMLDKAGIVVGELETALELGAGERKALETIAADLVGKTVRLEVRENPELLGGIRLRLGNTLYDGSVSCALAELHKQLLQTSL